MAFDDAVQRVYSDDGKGDGVLTKQGLEQLSQWSDGRWFRQKIPPMGLAILDSVVEPCRASLVASRRELEALADEMYEIIDVESRKPRWLRKSVRERPELVHALDGESNSLRWLPLAMFAPAIESMLAKLDETTQQRDAIVTVIALHRLHRQSGAWPNSSLFSCLKFLWTSSTASRCAIELKTARPCCIRSEVTASMIKANRLKIDSRSHTPMKVTGSCGHRFGNTRLAKTEAKQPSAPSCREAEPTAFRSAVCDRQTSTSQPLR